MLIVLLTTLVVLFAVGFLGNRISRLPSNIWLLFLAQPLALSSTSMIVLAGGLLSAKIAPNPELATLPITGMILMTAAGVVPASILMKKFGRRKGTIAGLLIGFVGSLLAVLSAMLADFWMFVMAAGIMGFSIAFVAQMRFAAIESLTDIKDSPKAISILMIGSMFAAILGPEVATVGKDWIDSPNGFAGSFLGLAVMIVFSIVLIYQLKPIGISERGSAKTSRNLLEIVKQPIFIIALSSGAVAYGVMSYVMTASPLSMHHIDGHDLMATKWVVQSHIIAMYLPSLFTASLVRHLGIQKLMLSGAIIYFFVVLVALAGQEVMHYWWAMVLLGIGWNFLFTCGTLLLPESYSESERFRAQASNDFIIFFVQALASLSAGWILFSGGWNRLIYLLLPFLVGMLVISIWLIRIRGKKRII